ncbi:MAG: hypothetical protein ACRC0L_01645 [Angustibacter sp.]
MKTLKRLPPQVIPVKCPIVGDEQLPARPLDRMWVDEFGVPTAFGYARLTFTIASEPLLWFGRRAWWEHDGSIPAVPLEQTMWRVRAQAGTDCLLADLLSPLASDLPWQMVIL